ncbi:MAG: hypothetical protein JO006_19500 [Paucibacter sp.]|nr:hypothetical protein [Roseateles sp.]
MKKILAFLNQSAHETQIRAGVRAPELRGRFAELVGMPLLLGAFAFACIAALATNI